MRTQNTPVIELNKIKKIYGTGQAAVHALRGIDLRIERGDFVSIMGPSGSGKSTCLNILGCLDTPTDGHYLFEGARIDGFSRNQLAMLRRHFLGFVFQGFNLLSRTSALENVELPLIYRGVPVKERKTKAAQALDAVGLKGWETHTPAELSGGQQQRVAIARAIVTQPDVLMADEPTGNLDTVRSHETMELLVELNTQHGITIVMVTHEPEMTAYTKRTIHFRDGHIESDKTNGDRI